MLLPGLSPDVRHRRLHGARQLNVADIPLHDTYYVIAHFHYVVAPGRSSPCSRASTTKYPKATGRKMNETLGMIHFVGSFVCMNVVFMPMFWLGRASRGGCMMAARPTSSHSPC
jgi:cytochrome c oxidase subunit 1